jgi:type IV secretory pathway TrbD component
MTVREIPFEYCAPIRESANRPHLLMGCEPFLVGAAVFVAVVWVLSLWSLIGVVTGAVVFLFLIQTFRQMAKKDPYWMRIWFDGKRWIQGWWPAHSQPPRLRNWEQSKGRR